MTRVDFRAMGCQMAAMVDNEYPRAARALREVPAWFEEWEQSLSRFRPDSELNRLNASAGAPFPASDILWHALDASLCAAKESDGLVLPNLLVPLEQAGYTESFEKIASTDQSFQGASSRMASYAGFDWAPDQELPSWREIHMDAQSRTVTIPRGMKLDLGGSAKGWAAQQAMLRLRPLGAVLVDAGGDIACSGPRRGGERWPVAVADPLRAQEQLAMLALGGCGVATSGIDYRRWMRDGAWKHHIIDPRTGQPAETDLVAVTVVAQDILLAEMAAKVVMILGSREGARWLSNRPHLSALLVLQDGRMLSLNGFDETLWREQ